MFKFVAFGSGSRAVAEPLGARKLFFAIAIGHSVSAVAGDLATKDTLVQHSESGNVQLQTG
jgi:hypothetical protein